MRTISALIGWLIFCTPAFAVDRELVSLADGIADESNRLRNATYRKSFAGEHTDDEIIESLYRIKLMIRAYEEQLRPPKPPIVLPPKAPTVPPPVPAIDKTYIGTSSPVKDGDSTLYTEADVRKRLYRTIKIEHVSGERYIRIRDVKITSAKGQTHLFNAGGGKFHLGDTYEIELPRPMHISEISIRVQHRTGGLKLSGDLAPEPVVLPTVIELGVSNGVKDGSTTLNTQPPHRKLRFRKLQFQHTGGDEYIRLGGLEITTVNDTKITMDVPRKKLYPNKALEIELPRPMHIKTIQLRVQHRTAGLRISAIR